MILNINEIMDMLDWNQNSYTQEIGRKEAGKVECLKIFMQPKDMKYNKNVWENCALILKEKNDALLQPYLSEMLEWIHDMNWPGANIILKRLNGFKNVEMLGFAIDESVKIASATSDIMWLYWMSTFLERENIERNLSEETKIVLQNAKSYVRDM